MKVKDDSSDTMTHNEICEL